MQCHQYRDGPLPFIHVVGHAVELLRADDEVHIGELVNEFPASTLRHAAQKSEDHAGAVLAELPGEILHLADGLVLGVVAHAACVEQHDIGDGQMNLSRGAMGPV